MSDKSNTKKYCLGNQPGEYELSDDYLGWIPEGFSGWEAFHDEYSLCGRDSRPNTIVLVSLDGKESAAFNLHTWLNKDAFPLSFFGEARTADWWDFLLLSKTEKPEEKFIIPMY